MIFYLTGFLISFAFAIYFAFEAYKLAQKLKRFNLVLTKQKMEYEAKIKEVIAQAKASEVKARKDAITRSRAVIRGSVWEEFAPLALDYDPADCHHMGAPIDYLVFDGLAEGDLRQIVFLELKSGRSRLSRREAVIREAVKEGKVSYEVARRD